MGHRCNAGRTSRELADPTSNATDPLFSEANVKPLNEAYRPVVEWLQDRGYGEDEIGRVLDRLRDYDKLTNVDALMDAIATGDVDMDAIIKEHS
jgi:hypothetical protein